MAKNNNIVEKNNAVEKKTKHSYVKELRRVLTEGRIADESLKNKVETTLSTFDKDQTKVSKSTIVDLCNEVIQYMASNAKTETPAPVEASLKPKKTTAKAEKSTKPVKEAEETAEEETSEESAVTEEAPAEEAPKTEKTGKKKSSLKKSDKDSKKKTPEVESLPAASNVGADNLPSAKMFPAEIDHPELGKIVACVGDYTTYADILKALEEEKTLYFAAYWTKRHIREYQYAQAKMIDPKVVKNGFPLDLDILMAVLPCETMERVYAMSRITEALFQFEGEDFKYIEDTDPRSGDKFRIRVSAGMEFEIYRPADEEVVTA